MSVIARSFDMRGNVLAVSQIIGMLRRHPELIWEMAKRELKDRYSGNALGLAWAVGAPLAIFAANILAFLFIFRVRLGPADTGASYAAYVLAGMAVWVAAGEILGRAPIAVTQSSNLVKQIVFPSEILPLKIVIAGLPTLALCTGVVVVLSFAVGHATLFGICCLLPLATVYFVVMMAGLSYALAGIGVFLRDVKDVVALLLSIGLFLHPILYAPASVPAALETAFLFSPFSHLIWCFRDALFEGRIVHTASWIVCPILSVVFLILGWRVFRSLRPTFGNVL
jgi:lipopolysaccharide transport system permease protein